MSRFSRREGRRPDQLEKAGFPINAHRTVPLLRWAPRNPEAALVKLLEIANALEADHAGRISVGAINHAFLSAGGNVNEYCTAMHRAVADGWMEAHPSGAYVKFTQAGAEHSPVQGP
jgi:hypothetical protein